MIRWLAATLLLVPLLVGATALEAPACAATGPAATVAAAGPTSERKAGVESICPKNITVFLRTSVSLSV